MADINIFYTCDNKFSQHLAVSIASLLYNAAKDDDIDIFIIHSDIDKINQSKIQSLQKIKHCNIKFIKIEDSIFAGYKTPDYINSSASLYRYLVAKLKPEIDKAVYLDCDTVVCDSLAPLFELNLKDNYIAGVEDMHSGMFYKRLAMNTTINEPYFNSGVLLINCEKWRNDNIFEKLIEQTNKLNPKMLGQLDQDAINIIAHGKKIVLHPKYNLLSCYNDEYMFTNYSLKELEEAQKNPVIIHFSADIKPWMKKGFPLNKFAYQYHKYLKLTPYSMKFFALQTSITNPKVAKYYKKLKTNTVVKLIFDFIFLFVILFDLIISFLSLFKYYKKFKKESLL